MPPGRPCVLHTETAKIYNQRFALHECVAQRMNCVCFWGWRTTIASPATLLDQVEPALDVVSRGILAAELIALAKKWGTLSDVDNVERTGQ